ncbi:MAG: LytTR family DNA-binding domain-containing protein [Spirosomaceae bacterium]|jgi:DNA-binding LytR/AlgR family response regulator|nr:LytTR family DNA-binding domain-containing protein [Spirosomataceae bacterium]
MLRTIAIDDEAPALEIIKNYAAKVPFLELNATFLDAFEAMAYLKNEPIDLIFLDIKMPDISGLEFLRTLSRPPMVIFTTGYQEYAVQSYDHNAVDYLLKVFSLERFLKACNKAYDLWQKSQANVPVIDYIFVKDGYESVRVFFDDILYIEAKGNYALFVTKQQSVVGRITMKEAIALLPKPQFVRVHKSYIVARDKIEKFDRYYAAIGTKKIPIGGEYKI